MNNDNLGDIFAREVIHLINGIDIKKHIDRLYLAYNDYDCPIYSDDFINGVKIQLDEEADSNVFILKNEDCGFKLLFNVNKYSLLLSLSLMVLNIKGEKAEVYFNNDDTIKSLAIESFIVEIIYISCSLVMFLFSLFLLKECIKMKRLQKSLIRDKIILYRDIGVDDLR